MNIFEKICDKIGLHVIWKGNRKKVTKQIAGQLQVQQDHGTVNVFNIQTVSVAQIQELAQIDPLQGGNAALQSAAKRFLFEQAAKQKNLNNTVDKASLPTIETPNSLQQDWFMKWMVTAQEISREEIQIILAKILAGEIQTPNSYSLRTLEVIKNLSQSELQAFQEFVAISCRDGFFHLGNTSNAEALKKYNLVFGTYAHLAEIGLFNPSSSLNITFELQPNIPIQILIKNNLLIITSNEVKTLQLGILKFTGVGAEIYSLLHEPSNNSRSEEYINDLIKHIESKGFIVQKNLMVKNKMVS